MPKAVGTGQRVYHRSRLESVIGSRSYSGQRLDPRTNLFGEATHFFLEWLELQHEELDPELVELLDPLGHLVVGPDQSGGGAAVGADVGEFLEGLEHHGLG